MKKIILVLCLLLCGCNKLTCIYEEKYTDVKLKNKIIFNFKNNTYKQIDTMTFKTNESAEDYFIDISEYIDEYNLELKNNVISSIIEDKIKLDGDKSKIKKQYENYGYKCK